MGAGAFDAYMAALERDPNNPAALYGCAVVMKEQQQLTDCIEYLTRALAVDGSFRDAKTLLATAHTDLGTCLKLAGKSEDGTLSYIKATETDETYSPAFYNLGVVHAESGKPEEALQFYTKATALNANYPEAHCNIGVIHKNAGRLAEAVSSYEAALAASPNFALARNNLAVALTDLGTATKVGGDLKGALRHYKRALTFNSAYPDTYYNLGVAYTELQKPEKAILNYELAVHFNPAHFEACNNLGALYGTLDNAEMTMKWYQMALAINPTYFQTNNNLSIIYTTQGMTDDALRCAQISISANPAFAEAYNNLGVLYRDLGQMPQALAAYEQCLALCPTARNAAQNKLLALNYLSLQGEECTDAHIAWGRQFVQQACEAYPALASRRAVSREAAESDEMDDGDKSGSDSPADGDGAAAKPAASETLWGTQPWVVDMSEASSERVLTVGYISPDFFTHSVSYFIEAPLARHDRTRFRIICYAHVPKGDAKTARFKEMVGEENWRQIEALQPHDVAELIAKDGVDILVDLAGHTANNRLDVFALRPAPIQMTWIGYPNTTGLPRSAMDYRVTDALADPLDTAQRHTEELVRMPRSFLCYTPHRPMLDVAPLPALSNGFVTFGTFNALSKLSDEAVAVYAAVLQAVPRSRFVLKAKPFATESVCLAYRERFAAHGIPAERLELLGLVPHNTNHLSAYGLLDISLDPWPYAGTTTTCEAMLMGVPSITLRGDGHAHNVGVSLLTNTGHPEWVASTTDEYVQKAVDLASDVPALAAVRGRLRDEFLGGGVCRSDEFVGELEELFTGLWSGWIARDEHVDVATANAQGAACAGSETGPQGGKASGVDARSEPAAVASPEAKPRRAGRPPRVEE